MNLIEQIIEDLEGQLDVLEAALATGRPLDAPDAFAPPATVGLLTGESRARAEALHRRLIAAQQLVAGELERTRQELAMTERAPGAPRFLDTTF